MGRRRRCCCCSCDLCDSLPCLESRTVSITVGAETIELAHYSSLIQTVNSAATSTVGEAGAICPLGTDTDAVMVCTFTGWDAAGDWFYTIHFYRASDGNSVRMLLNAVYNPSGTPLAAFGKDMEIAAASTFTCDGYEEIDVVLDDKCYSAGGDPTGSTVTGTVTIT